MPHRRALERPYADRRPLAVLAKMLADAQRAHVASPSRTACPTPSPPRCVRGLRSRGARVAMQELPPASAAGSYAPRLARSARGTHAQACPIGYIPTSTARLLRPPPRCARVLRSPRSHDASEARHHRGQHSLCSVAEPELTLHVIAEGKHGARITDQQAVVVACRDLQDSRAHQRLHTRRMLALCRLVTVAESARRTGTAAPHRTVRVEYQQMVYSAMAPADLSCIGHALQLDPFVNKLAGSR